MREDASQAMLARLVAAPIAHRGLHGCGRRGPVENSIGAAQAAVGKHYAIECDVRLSRDGEAMVFHDESLDRLTGTSGRLADHEAAALQRLRLGEGDDRIPTLAEFLDTIGGRVALVIEIKNAPGIDLRLADRTLAVLETYRGPVAIESFDPAVVSHCRRRGARIPIGLVGPPEAGGAADRAALADADFVSWSIDQIGAIARQAPTLPRTAWTVRTPAQAASAARHQAQIVFEGFEPPRPFEQDAAGSD